jgi:hypothetical protein
MHAPEPQHGPLSSSEQQVRVLGPVIGPASHLAVMTAAKVFRRSAVGPERLRHYGLGSNVALHRFLKEFQRCFAITRLDEETFQRRALVIKGPPKVLG